MLLDRKLTTSTQTFLVDLIKTWLQTRPSSPVYDHVQMSVFKKFVPELKTNPILHDKAVSKFLWSEDHLRACNIRHRLISPSFLGGMDQAVISTASRKIRSILGSFDIEEMLNLGRFGPGSTSGISGSDVSLPRKFDGLDVTFEFLPLARGLMAEYPHWSGLIAGTDLPVCPMLKPVPGGKFTSVPKDDSENRGIIAEPTINSWFQQGIARMIRRRLKSASVNLEDQTLNQRLARLGSLSNDIATVDQTSASDLIHKSLVRELVPDDWFFWLDVTRSHRVTVNSDTIELEKFCSMGNGFTFDLESLIFYALGWAVTVLEGFNPFWVNIFGDDLVLPSGCEARLKSAFSSFGFVINEKKSFFSGPFRESCGKDFYLGQNIRGFYVRRLQTEYDVLKCHNAIYRWLQRTGVDDEDCKLLLATLRIFAGPFNNPVPLNLGDSGLTTPFDVAKPVVWRRGWDSLCVTINVPIVRSRDRFDRNALVARLSQQSIYNRNSFPLRVDAVVGYKQLKIPSFWEDRLELEG